MTKTSPILLPAGYLSTKLTDGDMSKLPPPEWAADEIFTYATKLRAKHRVRLFHAARTLSLQPPAQVKRVLIQAYGYYARLGGRTSQVVALVKKLFDEAGAAIEVVEGFSLE